jgi:hypothetical protein
MSTESGYKGGIADFIDLFKEGKGKSFTEVLIMKLFTSNLICYSTLWTMVEACRWFH